MENIFGICSYNMVAVRGIPLHKSEIVTQLLFGDIYACTALSDDGNWLYISTLMDDYEGWISLNQHSEAKAAYIENYLSFQNHGVCLDDFALVEGRDGGANITLGATLPFLKGRNILIGDKSMVYQGDLIEIPKNPDREYLVFLALRFLNTPYLWGGKSLFGIDCSGFVQQVYKLCGYSLKRDAYLQADQGVVVESLAHIIPGDLAFFENETGKIVHVGMILEKNRIIHAHGHVRIDVVDEKGIFNLTTKKYSHNLTRIQRILQFGQLGDR